MLSWNMKIPPKLIELATSLTSTNWIRTIFLMSACLWTGRKYEMFLRFTSPSMWSRISSKHRMNLCCSNDGKLTKVQGSNIWYFLWFHAVSKGVLCPKLACMCKKIIRCLYQVRHGEDTEIWWHDPLAIGKRTLDERRNLWTENVVRWSPLGTYLATLHPQGVQFWGGPDWNSMRKFAHPSVQLIDFSPHEKYIVTWYQNMSVFEVKTQKKLKSFVGGPTQQYGWYFTTCLFIYIFFCLILPKLF